MPTAPDAVARATGLRKQGRYGQAMQVLRGVLADRADRAAALEAARVLTDVCSYVDAWELSRTHLDRDLEDVDALILRSEIRCGLGRIAAGVDDATAATVLAPSYAPAWSQLAAARWIACDGSGSARALREALRLDPDDVVALNGLEPLAERAWPILRAAADRNADDALRLVAVALSCAGLGDLREARRYADRALVVDPDRDEARIMDGWLHLHEGRFEDLERVATQLLAELDSGVAHWLRAYALYAQARLDEAVAEFDHAIAQAPAEIDSLRVRGDVQFHRGRWADAVRDAGAVLDRKPDDVEARLLRARARVALDDNGAALRDIAAVLAADAGHAEALTLRADIKLLDGDDAGALVDVDRALGTGTASVDALLTCGLALTRLQRNYDAAAAFRAVLELDPRNEPAARHLALATRLWRRHPRGMAAAIADVSVGGTALAIILGVGPVTGRPGSS